MVKKTFIINGVTRNILVDENETLATFLRERLLLTGCKIGCGEAPLDAPHPAILNAIYNATGARITRIPTLPEVVLAALKDLEK